jgi:NADH-quinone oxidoreductase subunit J
MTVAFYISAIVAVIATLFAITRRHAVHALLYLIVSLLAIAVIFYILGAPFIAALELIIYAGAIMVLFVFVVMMLNLGEASKEMEREWLRPRVWIGPTILGAILFGEVAYALATGAPATVAAQRIGAKQVAIALFGPYVIGVELVSLLLMGGLVGAYHLGRRTLSQQEELHDARANRARLIAGGEPVHDRPRRTTHAA